MSLSNFGLKASGMCLGVMLAHGVPSHEVFDHFLNEIDRRLADNEFQIESCVKDLTESGQELVMSVNGSSAVPSDTVELLKQILDQRLLDKSSCYDISMEKILQIIKHLSKTLETTPGSEDSVLQTVLRLSSTEGISLPCCVVSPALPVDSVVSLNTVIDSSEHAVEDAWNQLCMQLRRCYIDRLKQLQDHSGAIDRRTIVDSLCALFPELQIEAQYRDIRQNQLTSCIDRYLHPAGSNDRKQKFEVAVKSFSEALTKILSMMSDDFELYVSGAMGRETDDAFQCLADIYFEIIRDEFESVVEKLSSELPGSGVSKKRGSKSGKQTSKVDDSSASMSKSPSDYSFFGRRFGGNGNRKNQSHSSDNITDSAGLSAVEEFTDLHHMDGKLFAAVVELMDCMLNFDHHVDTWKAAVSSSWHNVIDVGQEKKPRQSLKSALKTQQNVIAEIKSEANKSRKPGFGIKRDSIKNNAVVPLCVNDEVPPTGNEERVPLLKDASLVERPHVDWRSCFTKFSDILTWHLRSSLHLSAESALKDEKDLFKRTGSIGKVEVPSHLVTATDDYPKFVSKYSLAVMTKFDRWLPLAKAGSERPLSGLKSAFVDALVSILNNALGWLCQLYREPALQTQPSNSYLVLSSLLFLLDLPCRLSITLSLDETSEQTMSDLCARYQKATEQLISQIQQHHCSVLVSCVLRDAESHDWADSKEFYEGERCSFDIQAWNLYMNGLRNDVWSCCPQRESRLIFASVLRETLSHFAWRYARVQPTRRRVKQFISDITAILLCTSDLLLFACDTIGKYLDPCDADGDTFFVHNYCCCLLSTLAVVGAPVDSLYRAFRKGFCRKSSRSDADHSKGYFSHWLSWMRPSLFPLGKISYNDLQMTSALYLQLCLLKAQPNTSCYHLLLEALLMKECTLSIMILTHFDNPVTTSVPTFVTLSGTSPAVYCSFIDVLIKCTEFPSALACVMLPVIERSNEWQLFDSSVVIGKTHKVPLWLLSLSKQLKSFINRILEPGINLLVSKKRSLDIPSLCAELPCGCLLSSGSSMESDQDATEPLVECIYSVLSQLVSDLFALPVPVVMFFQTAQGAIAEKAGIVVPFKSAGLKLIATFLRSSLLDVESLEMHLACTLTEHVKDNIRMLGECVYHVLTSTAYGKDSSAPRIASLFMKANRNWISEQIETITEHLSSDLFKCPKSHPLKEMTPDYIKALLKLQAESILDTETGAASLSSVQLFVMSNLESIIAQLDISPLLASDDGAGSNLKQTSGQATVPTGSFNPLQAYDLIGSAKFDHAAILSFYYDWSALLRSDLGITEVGFRTLLFNRHDMQDGAHLEESEKRLVEILRKRYEADLTDSSV